MDEMALIQRLLAPVLIIPACGLLILSTSARLSALLARIRSMHMERINAIRATSGGGSIDAAIRSMRIEGIEEQTHAMLRRATLQRNAMLLLFFAVIAMSISSLLLGIAVIAPTAETLAGVAFVLGLLFVLVAMVCCVLELGGALAPIRYEHKRVEKLCAEQQEDP